MGQFSIRLDQQPVDIPSRPAQSLLAYLVLNAGTAHRREKLAGMFWPETTESNARSNLRHALWRLRKSLGKQKGGGDAFLLTDNISITFNTEADYWVDADILAQNGGIDHSIDTLITEVKEYGGELLPGFYEDWVVLERERLRALYETKIQKLLDLLVNAARWREILEWGERGIALGQAPEPAFRALMLAYHGLGDFTSLANTYQRCREALQSYLGVEPSKQTQEIYAAVSAGRPPPVSLWVSEVKLPPASSAIAISRLLKQWRGQHDKILDLPTMAVIYAGRADLQVAPEDARLLIRSALHHGVDVAPWLKRAGTPQVASAALKQILDTYPPPRIRMKIVEALKELPIDEADEILLEIASTDDDASVRTEASVAAAQRGHVETVATNLLTTIKTADDPGALSALVAVADEVGLPIHLRDYPKVSFITSMLRRRWSKDRTIIIRQAYRSAIGAAIFSGLNGLLFPLYTALFNPESYRNTMEDWSVQTLSFISGFTMLFIGAFQGLIVGLIYGMIDSSWQNSSNIKRALMGSVAGLYFAMLYQATFSLLHLLNPASGPETYLPTYFAFGLWLGSCLSIVTPRLGTTIKIENQVPRIALAGVLIALGTYGYVTIVYNEYLLQVLVDRLLESFMLPLGIGIALAQSKGRERLVPEPRPVRA